MSEKTGQALRKLSPRLQVIMADDPVTNALRAEQAPELIVTKQSLLDDVPRLDGLDKRFAAPDAVEHDLAAAFAPLQEEAGALLVSAFLELEGDDQEMPDSLTGLGVKVTRRRQNLFTVTVPQDNLEALYHEPSVRSVGDSERIVYNPPLETSIQPEPAPGPRTDAARAIAAHGAGPVLIGIVDVGGFDFAHPDFLDGDGHTRFMRIWDQGGDTRPHPDGFSYGAELRKEHMDAALKAVAEFGIPAHRLEPQSQMVYGSHGTHVASIAAGNRGVCPEAYLAGVLLSFPEEGGDAREQFFDSPRLAHAVDYLFNLGQELKVPVSINISLGTNGHAHDASSPISRWIDSALSTKGRCVCVAAGNAGQEAATEPGDLGFIMGRIHTRGRIAAAGLSRNIEWIVAGDGIDDVSDNQLVIWYGPQDRFAVEVIPPVPAAEPCLVEPGAFLQTEVGPNHTKLLIRNDLYVPANGHNAITCHLSPHRSLQGVDGIQSGLWLVRLHGRDVRDGVYHGWIERDDPRRLSRLGYSQDWSFPSFFSRNSNVDNSSISSLASGYHVIAVANLDEANERINISSSQGPTRDGRQKPEIAAAGTNVVAANGFELEPSQQWIAMTGTSMASPYVAGVVGLMLAVAPDLTAEQIAGIIRRTSRPLPGADYAWQDDAGFGVIDARACVDEAAIISGG